jgi:uncharacterized OsmC-like protein
MTLDKLKVEVKDITVQVDLVRDIEGKTIFNYKYNIDADLNENQKKTIEDSVSNCSVKKTLLKSISFENHSMERLNN